MAYDDDDFFFDDDALNDESQLTLIDETKLEVLKEIKDKINEAEGNIENFEPAEFRANFAIISRHVGAITELDELQAQMDAADISGEKGPSDAEVYDKIEAIKLSAKELTYTDLKVYEKNQTKIDPDATSSDTDDDDFGF